MESAEISILADNISLQDAIGRIVEEGPTEEPIHVLYLDDVVEKHRHWMQQLPQVKPFYAIKSNDNPALVQTLATLGTGFDCASKGEIDKVLAAGVSPDRIIFAQPAKPIAALLHAKKHGIKLMTFDGKHELDKIKSHYPEAHLVLRFRYDSDQVFAQLGKKFGCDPGSEALDLLRYAKELELNVIGLSFHIGSGTKDYCCFEAAIEVAKKIFDSAKCIGYDFTLLDIGGGFPGAKHLPIDPYAEHINRAIDKHFSQDEHVTFIAEPGRYYAASAVTIITHVLAKRMLSDEEGKELMYYYINDGIFGSFYSAGHEAQPVYPVIWKPNPSTKLQSWIWGPSCDGLDVFCKDIPLPELDIGDFILFENAGAYSIVIASQFNGFPLPRVEVYVSQSTWKALKNAPETASR
ncbi:ornithine decarboxylase 1-like [Sabethes cyaneus]|uniref:ornithine decarboxylase 1-like n=1 Tax=Sabethes cyaneus TaxID=53552 RepID=UPI00237D4AF1|nr:ornithine decarboxylase 1-like [Sabethes cyaneus]